MMGSNCDTHAHHHRPMRTGGRKQTQLAPYDVVVRTQHELSLGVKGTGGVVRTGVQRTALPHNVLNVKHDWVRVLSTNTNTPRNSAEHNNIMAKRG